MSRLTLIPRAPMPAPPCPSADLRDLIAELHAARDGTLDGPAVLWLFNDLMLCCENLCEDCEAESGPVAHVHREFLSGLTRFAEGIRRSNGELSDDFIAFLASAPLSGCNPASN